MKQRLTLPPMVVVALVVGNLWCASVMLTSFFNDDLFEALWVLLDLWWIVLIGFGLPLVIWAVVAALAKDRKAALPALVPLVIGIAFLSIWNFGGGAAWGEQMRFEMKRGSYDAALALIKHDKMPAAGTVNGLSYRCDETFPQRVSFIEKGGILDNYTAIIYDPSDTVLLTNKFKGDWSNFNDPKLRHIKKLFGGDMMWATPLGKHWYRCGFT